eukprot:449058-Pelagomonas_calceolata.AAC.6
MDACPYWCHTHGRYSLLAPQTAASTSGPALVRNALEQPLHTHAPSMVKVLQALRLCLSNTVLSKAHLAVLAMPTNAKVNTARSVHMQRHQVVPRPASRQDCILYSLRACACACA